MTSEGYPSDTGMAGLKRKYRIESSEEEEETLSPTQPPGEHTPELFTTQEAPSCSQPLSLQTLSQMERKYRNMVIHGRTYC